MLSPKLKADIRKLWDRFWAGGIANPLSAIEQITYLVFLKRLEDLDNERAQQAREQDRPFVSLFEPPKGDNTYRWSYIKQLSGEERLRHIRGPVFDWLKTIEGAEDRMRDAVFIISNPTLLEGAISTIDDLFIPSRNQDTLGDIYEMLLAEIAEAGRNGQFRTPRHIIRAMCDLVDPQLGERICDPACGTAGFLVNAYQHILKTHTSPDILQFEADGTPLHLVGDQLTPEQHEELRRNHFYGYDFDRTMARLGWMNMIQHGLENPQIHNTDSLGSSFDEQITSGAVGDFDVVLANPPFTGNLDKTDIGEHLSILNTTKTELLFIQLILRLLRVGGRAAVIVPEGVLFGSTSAHKKLREELVSTNQLNAVISLPGGVFQPYTGVKTSILVFTKGGTTDEVWFYELSADGYTLNAKRSEQPEKNDIWDMTLKYRLRHSAAFPQPAPAFVNGEIWQQWAAYPAEDRALHYAQPRIMSETVVDPDSALAGKTLIPDEMEAMSVTLLQGVETLERAESNDWTAEMPTIKESNYNLSAGRYKPLMLSTRVYEPPADIIRDLRALELVIMKELRQLKWMVEDNE